MKCAYSELWGWEPRRTGRLGLIPSHRASRDGCPSNQADRSLRGSTSRCMYLELGSASLRAWNVRTLRRLSEACPMVLGGERRQVWIHCADTSQKALKIPKAKAGLAILLTLLSSWNRQDDSVFYGRPSRMLILEESYAFFLYDQSTLKATVTQPCTGRKLWKYLTLFSFISASCL